LKSEPMLHGLGRESKNYQLLVALVTGILLKEVTTFLKQLHAGASILQ
jgi:hypothetical protein